MLESFFPLSVGKLFISALETMFHELLINLVGMGSVKYKQLFFFLRQGRFAHNKRQK